MNQKQRTLKTSVTVTGVGLHTGSPVNMTFHPAPENHGYKFQRIDLPDSPIIDADVDNVVETARGTTIAQNNASVATIEHTLAALVGCELDNVLISLDGPECPIMDGSSKMFVDAILKTGIVEQEAEREYFTVTQNIYYADEQGQVEMIAMPSEDYRVTVMVDYNSPVLGSQHASISNINEFNKEISSSRTFCFLHELEMLLSHNLIKGGDLNNAIVVVDKEVAKEELANLAKLFNRESVGVGKEGILNNVELRHQNEPARHKLLDVVGDLALAGMPLKAHIMAARPGHSSNVAFAKRIKAMIKKDKLRKNIPVYDATAPALYDINKIASILPHRPPFLLVDKILELTPKYVVGVKNVTMNEPFFVGHFPGNPVMPGVLQIEALAQTGGILVLSTVPDPDNYWTYFLKIDNTRFKDKVLPGDTLIMRCDLISPIRRGIAQMRGVIMVGDKIVMESEMMAQIARKAEA